MLLVGLDEDQVRAVERALRAAHPETVVESTAFAADLARAIERCAPDLLLAPNVLALALLRARVVNDTSVPVVALTDLDDERGDRAAIEAGAADSLSIDLLPPKALHRALLHAIARERSRRASSCCDHKLGAARALQPARCEAERHYRALFDQSPIAIWLFDDRSHQLLAANTAVVERYGWTLEELLSMRVEDIHAPEDRARLATALASKEPIGNGSWRHLTKDGRRLDVELSRVRLTYSGRAAHLWCIQDTTERKRAEELERRLLQAHKLESIGRLAGGVAHDFNNLLAVIIGYARSLIEQREDDVGLRSDLEEIAKAADRAAGLTRDLLAFSRQQSVKSVPLELNRAIESIERLLVRLLGEDVRLMVRLPPRSPRIEIDPLQLEQVLMNLSVNARDAMPNGGTLTISVIEQRIEAPAARVLGVDPGEYAILHVEDTGVGMDPHTASRAFEPFFTTKAHGKGTGLGLSTVFGIIKQNGGHISLESSPGEGTAFDIYLPITPKQSPVPASPPIEAQPATAVGETILVVEDDPAVRKLACKILRRRGYRVLESSGPGEALLACEREPGRIDLVLTDVLMPLMSGTELVTRLSERRRDLKVLYMSGYSADALPAQGLRAELIEKPFGPPELLEVVARVLKGAAPAAVGT